MKEKWTEMDEDEFFEGYGEARQIYGVVKVILTNLGAVSCKVTKSQVAFSRRRQFAWVWIPSRYLAGERPPLVLSLSLRRRDPSPRWKEVMEPYAGRFMHHLELHTSDQLDAQVRDWLKEAFDQAA